MNFLFGAFFWPRWQRGFSHSSSYKIPDKNWNSKISFHDLSEFIYDPGGPIVTVLSILTTVTLPSITTRIYCTLSLPPSHLSLSLQVFWAHLHLPLLPTLPALLLPSSGSCGDSKRHYLLTEHCLYNLSWWWGDVSLILSLVRNELWSVLCKRFLISWLRSSCTNLSSPFSLFTSW